MIGKTVSRFRKIEKLGGGTGICKDEDVNLDRAVALKFLTEISSEDRHVLQRFERRARAVSTLIHTMMHGTYDVYDVMNRQDGIPSPWSSWKGERNSSTSSVRANAI